MYMVKWVYTRRQTRLYKKADVFALYLSSDLYCTVCVFVVFRRLMMILRCNTCVCVVFRRLIPVRDDIKIIICVFVLLRRPIAVRDDIKI